MWKLSTNHSAAGVIARSSRMALAIARYASRSTRPLSSTRGNSRRPFSNSLMTGWAAARLSVEGPGLALRPARRSELLDQSRRRRASDDLERAHPVDIAEALNLLDPRVAGRALSSLPFDLAVPVLEQPEFDRRAAPP